MQRLSLKEKQKEPKAHSQSQPHKYREPMLAGMTNSEAAAKSRVRSSGYGPKPTPSTSAQPSGKFLNQLTSAPNPDLHPAERHNEQKQIIDPITHLALDFITFFLISLAQNL